MNKDYSDITLVVDRSGSMQGAQQEATNGIRTFINDQKNQPGTTLLSLLQFDQNCEWVYKSQNIEMVNAESYTLEPRGMTALYDAIGLAIKSTGERLSQLPEEERPGVVSIVILTDGEENSSQEYNQATIRAMTEHQQKTYNWKFNFLGANQDAIMVGGDLGVVADCCATYNVHKYGNTMGAVSGLVRSMRGSSIQGGSVSCSFSDSDRDSMGDS